MAPNTSDRTEWSLVRKACRKIRRKMVEKKHAVHPTYY